VGGVGEAQVGEELGAQVGGLEDASCTSATAIVRPANAGLAAEASANRCSTEVTSASASPVRPSARPVVRVCSCHVVVVSADGAATVGAIRVSLS
jgi:hypothetical protein